MPSNTRYRRALIALAVLLAVIVAVYYAWKLAVVGTAFAAKTLCSGVFVSHRDASSVLDTDLSPDIHPILRYLDARVDPDAREVRASLFGLAKRRATYREGLRCVVDREEATRFAAFAGFTPSPSLAERASVGDDAGGFDKIPNWPERDSRWTAEIARLWKHYEDRAVKHRKSGVADPNLDEFRWQLEELRVSLFAQELKTPAPVSVKRLEKLWGMVAV